MVFIISLFRKLNQAEIFTQKKNNLCFWNNKCFMIGRREISAWEIERKFYLQELPER